MEDISLQPPYAVTPNKCGHVTHRVSLNGLIHHRSPLSNLSDGASPDKMQVPLIRLQCGKFPRFCIYSLTQAKIFRISKGVNSYDWGRTQYSFYFWFPRTEHRP